MALEGSSLTLLGLVKYDAGKDSFEMTELFSVLSGGIQEAKRCLAERIELLNGASQDCFVVAAIALAITAYFNYII